MEKLLEKISEELKIDKSQWIPTKFGDVAIQQKGKVDRDNTDLTRYVQGGHMNSEDLHLRSWGVLEDEYLGPAFIRRFDEGDILYGSRRTYLRKVVIAPFSGITSNTTFVIRANEKNIDKRLLPFIMMSEGFTENSVRNSKGSVNPYINWKDIAKYEFLLPPLDQQAQLAKLLWAMDEVIENEKEVLSKADIIYERLLLDFFQTDYKYDKVELGSLVNIKSGDSPSAFKFTSQYNGYPFYKVKDLNETIKFQNFAKEWVDPISSKIIVKNSVIFPKRGAAIMTNKVRITVEDCHVDTNTMALSIKDNQPLLAEFLYYFLYFKKLYKIADTSQIPQINNVHINPYTIHLPPISTQNDFVGKLNILLDSRKEIVNKKLSSQFLQKSLINQIF